MSQRFTDAELAAEYWALETELAYGEERMTGEVWERTYARQETIHRFATLPHALDPEPLTVYVYDQHGRCIGSFADPRPREPFRDWSINTGKDG